MMHLDGCTRSLETNTFNNIGVQCALKKPFNTTLGFSALLFFISSKLDLSCLVFKNVDKRIPNDFRFCSGSSTPSRRDRKSADASTTVRLTPRSLLSITFTCCASFNRKTPTVDHDGMEPEIDNSISNDIVSFFLKKKDYSCHRWLHASVFAATVLSTPPLTAPITRPLDPHISRIRNFFPINSSWIML